MTQLLLLGLFLLACSCGSAPDAPPPSSPAAQAVPAPGSLAFGSAEAAVAARLGAPTRQWEQAGFQWRAYRHGTTTVEAGFYRDKLGQVAVLPDAPMPWAIAVAWSQALAPGFDEARLHKDAPAWVYFQTIHVDGVPFEVGLRYERTGDQVAAIRGEMNWLD